LVDNVLITSSTKLTLEASILTYYKQSVRPETHHSIRLKTYDILAEGERRFGGPVGDGRGTERGVGIL
jgi:hypothetical protein